MLDEPRHAAGLRFNILCGPTGSAKTALLDALAAEAPRCSTSRGWPATGARCWAAPDTIQPGQKAFETRLWSALRGFRPGPAGVGRVREPARRAPACAGACSSSACGTATARCGGAAGGRVDHLLERYADLIADPAAFNEKLARLVPARPRAGGGRALVEAGAWRQLAEDLLVSSTTIGQPGGIRRTDSGSSAQSPEQQPQPAGKVV